MQIRKLELTNFRNLRDCAIEMPPGGSLVIGKNAQGKTNLLEAVYYLGALRSFRTRRDAQLIKFGEKHFRIRGAIGLRSGASVIEVGYDGRKKLVKVNGARPEKIRDAFGSLKVVIVTPDDVEIVRGDPSARRRFMDIVISMTSSVYLEVLSRYHEVLSQRNALLRAGQHDRGSITAWDSQISLLAAQLAARRKKFIDDLAGAYSDAHAGLDPESECELLYRTSPREARAGLEGWSEESAARFYEESLKSSYERDRDLGMTTVGPHRDDILIRLDGKDLRSFGSQGQQRTSVFAMRMAEARYIEQKTGETPVLLMDDVMSQLDGERVGRLLDMVKGIYQTIITTPREEHGGDALPGLARMRVEGGKIETYEGS